MVDEFLIHSDVEWQSQDLHPGPAGSKDSTFFFVTVQAFPACGQTFQIMIMSMWKWCPSQL